MDVGGTSRKLHRDGIIVAVFVVLSWKYGGNKTRLYQLVIHKTLPLRNILPN
jgi:hypothetical protein